jgi:methyl-accepting chemotaxis protein
MTEPLFRFARIFESVRQGILPGPIELRGSDYLKREVRALNEMTAELRSLIGEIKRRQLDLSGTIEEVAEVLSQDDLPRLSDLVGMLGEQDKSLRKSLDRFRDAA